MFPIFCPHHFFGKCNSEVSISIFRLLPKCLGDLSIHCLLPVPHSSKQDFDVIEACLGTLGDPNHESLVWFLCWHCQTCSFCHFQSKVLPSKVEKLLRDEGWIMGMLTFLMISTNHRFTHGCANCCLWRLNQKQKRWVAIQGFSFSKIRPFSALQCPSL